MKDLNLLSDRLDELSQSAPAPAVVPCDDIRRGQKALRRRRTRGAAGIAAGLVAVGIISTTVNLPGNQGKPGVVSPGSTARPHIQAASGLVSSLCLHEASRFDRSLDSRSSSPEPRNAEPLPEWKHPAVAPVLAAYRQAAASILDPSDTHLDAEVTNVQYGCDPQNVRLTSLGTTLGWTSSARGSVQLEVVSPEHSEKPQIVISHDRWIVTTQNLPAGVARAWATEYQGGRAVYVERHDGLTVAVDAVGTWGSNVVPGSPPARDLPTIAKLLTVAASRSLTLPED